VKDGKFVISERIFSMRNVIGLSMVLLMCAALSSCSGNKPEKAFMGTWKGMHEEEPVEFSFMEKGLCFAKGTGDETHAGTWIIGLEGNPEITFEGEDEKFIATPVNGGKIIIRQEGDSSGAVLEKSTPSKKDHKAYEAYTGTWKGMYNEEPLELSFFTVKNIIIWKMPSETIAGTWTIDHEGNARISVDGEKFIATLVTEDKIVVREEGDNEAALLEKIDSKKK